MTDLPTLHCALDPQDPVAAQCQHAADSPWILTRDIEGRLNLKDDRQPRQRPLIIDFHSDDIRRRISGGRKDLLARALGYKKGSSRFTGKRSFDLQEEVVGVAKSVGHAFDDFDLVVHAFEDAGVEAVDGAGDDAFDVAR